MPAINFITRNFNKMCMIVVAVSHYHYSLTTNYAQSACSSYYNKKLTITIHIVQIDIKHAIIEITNTLAIVHNN